MATGARQQVVVVGSINVDFVVRLARLPRAGETVGDGTFERHFGGKGANQAVAAARLGGAVSLIGAVGDDELGREALADLRREGVDTAGVSSLAGVATGVALIVVDATGENQIAVAAGANGQLSGESVERGLARLLRASSGGAVLASNFEVGDEALRACFGMAARHKLRVVFNAAPARPIPVELLEPRPVLVVNEGEAAALTGVHEPAGAARALAKLSGNAALLTLGARGALVALGDELTAIAAPAVAAVDTTGAGDTLVGALAAELADGAGLLDAAGFAVRAASLSVTRAGARSGMPTRAAVDALAAGSSP
jgi:ribokinase